MYTTSPPHVSSPRPTYRGCAGDILTPYLRVPHSSLSSSSSSDSDVTSLAATPCPWAARGSLAWGLGVFLIRLQTVLVVLAEARFASFPVTHRTHMTGCSLFHSFSWNPCSKMNPQTTTSSLVGGGTATRRLLLLLPLHAVRLFGVSCGTEKCVFFKSPGSSTTKV